MSIRQGRTIIAGNISTESIPLIGEIKKVLHSSSYHPKGCVLCDGTEYTSGNFIDLWHNYLISNPAKLPTCTYVEYASDISLTGECLKFAIDTTNLRFKVPTIVDSNYDIFVVLADGETNTSAIDWSTWNTNINALQNATSFTSTGKSTLAEFSMPSSYYEELTIGASYSEYTAAANGYFVFSVKTSNSTNYMYGLMNLNNYIASYFRLNHTDNVAAGFVPAKIGDTIQIIYEGSINTSASETYLYFVYAEGEI